MSGQYQKTHTSSGKSFKNEYGKRSCKFSM